MAAASCGFGQVLSGTCRKDRHNACNDLKQSSEDSRKACRSGPTAVVGRPDLPTISITPGLCGIYRTGHKLLIINVLQCDNGVHRFFRIPRKSSPDPFENQRGKVKKKIRRQAHFTSAVLRIPRLLVRF